MTATASSRPASDDLTQPLEVGRSLFNSGMTVLSAIFTLLAIVPLFSVLIYVLIQGFSSLSPAIFTALPAPAGSPGGGFGNAIEGTLLMVGIATLISVPFGVLSGIYLSEYARDAGGLIQAIRFGVNVLAGVPSIIIGVFAYGVVVLSTKTFSAYAGGFALAILMLPIIVRTTEEALKLVPWELRLGSLGLGANRFNTIARVIVPAALPGIVTGVMLSVSRAAGETAPLLFTALFSQYWVEKPGQPTASLAVLIFNYATTPYRDLQQKAWGASLLLLILVLIISITARFVFRRRF
ncbi:phosphate ABC transporter permease PstA [Gloeobacter kilaueensis]|uniref:Phosphate transport system permease protein PstA n=1 Tax=Gloeobacter kilaueensis (strain ATCC BAA-2537 / CCAP 1431/1 / ULC 316 / JS1) TaxID=1183438 RepID=U5QCB8_GLOK1|nr:phosphate ABC transporter permease PstA [Gloeobacter kilaueensis]AGY56511.1 phosphate transporter permease subunit PtsA [Gloeobacter kilaueensis JS1]